VADRQPAKTVSEWYPDLNRAINRSPRFLPVVLDAQLMSGSFEYALDYLIDHPLDLGTLDARYRNNDTY